MPDNKPHIEVKREQDGRILASVPAHPGVMAYGATQDEAVRKATSIALEIMSDDLIEQRQLGLS